MLLRFMDGPRSGKTVKITSDDYTMGRDDSCDLLLDSDGVSRVHSRIKKDGDTYILQDNKSTNGVYLNGTKIDEPTVLKDNDTIRISNCLMLFSSDENMLDTKMLEKLDEVREEKAGVPAATPDEAGETEAGETEAAETEAAEGEPPEVKPADEEDESPPKEETSPDQVVLDFSKKNAPKPAGMAEEDSGIKALLSGSTGIMILVVIILAVILAYIILTSPPPA